MDLFILFLLLSALVATSITLHYSFDFLGILPNPAQVTIQNQEFFQLNYTFYLNIGFLLGTAFLLWLGYLKYKDMHYMKEMAPKSKSFEKILKYISYLCYLWLVVRVFIKFFVL
ncbi:hypothetical protein [Algoriphagus sp.]|uniref:hypothetical protein n=1 Tax=Algoriphagus sp. TaxID=1872435 RepID=UPI0025E8971E|nr:hypothetical protein [Algoriphagus sp.]